MTTVGRTELDSARDEMTHDERVRHRLARLLRDSPIAPDDLVDTLALYLRRRPLADILTMDALYRMAMQVPGAMLELGVLQGRHLALLAELRELYEPHNVHREIVGFDTFTGFAGATEMDGLEPGKFQLPPSFADHLRAVMDSRAGDASGKEPVRLVAGDVTTTLREHLEANRHTVVAMAYFDLDLYGPTKEALTVLVPYLTKGSILAFDELAHRDWPGETAALRDALGLGRGAVRFVLPGRSKATYLRWEG